MATTKLNKLTRTLFSTGFAWIPIMGYGWHTYGGPIGAYYVGVAVMWVTLLMTPIIIVAFSDVFLKDYPEMRKTVAKDRPWPEWLTPWLFDSPDISLFFLAAWHGDAWLSVGACIMCLVGCYARGGREKVRRRITDGYYD